MVVPVHSIPDDITVLPADGEFEGVGVDDEGVAGLFEALRHRPWLTDRLTCRWGDTPNTSVQKHTQNYSQIHGEFPRKFFTFLTEEEVVSVGFCLVTVSFCLVTVALYGENQIM